MPQIRQQWHRTVLVGVVILLILTNGINHSVGEEETEIWQPPSPKPDAHDWVQLTSGEWLKGKIIALYEKELEFDSDKLKLQKLKWKDVMEIRSAGTMQVGMEDGSVAIGQILLEEETLTLIGQTKESYPRSDIVAITAGAPKEINYWAAKVSVGANLRSGNTDQIETTSKADIVRRTAKSRLSLDYLAAFNQTDDLTATDNQRASAGWNRFYSTKLFWTPLYGEWYRDPLQNISGRWTVGTGLGFEIIDTAEVDWEVSGGLAYQTIDFDSVAEGESPSANTPALVGSTNYNHELTDWMDFAFDYQFMVVNEESGSFTHHLLTGLEFEISKALEFDITLAWDRIKNPQANVEGLIPEQDDYRLMFFLGLDF